VARVLGTRPVVEAKDLSTVVGLDHGVDVTDDLLRQVVEVKPVDLAALARLGIGRLARPPGGGEEHPDPRLAVGVGMVAQVDEGQINGVNGDAEFLASLACCSGREGLAVVEASARY
jgi:hypothetical protein